MQKLGEGIYAIMPTTAEKETTKGIPQATTGGFIVGSKGVLLIEVMLSKRLYDQEVALIRAVTDKPIIYAVNTSDHGDHCFSNYLLPASTMIIQNEFAKDNLAKNYEGIKQFMVGLFGAGRGIESSVYRPADIIIPKYNNLKLDMGEGKIVEFLNVGTAQSPADLFVWMPNQKVFWAGNPFHRRKPGHPMAVRRILFRARNNLKKVYDFLPDDAIVIPGHGRNQ
jgi:glyoxylase-like metal-dependent hydrolase (beta-lactamase superfamily II)